MTPDLAMLQAAGGVPLPPAAGAPAACRSCVLVTDLREAEALRPVWAALLARSAGSELTQAPEWLLTWWRVYGPLQGRQLRLALFWDAGQLVGVAPLLGRRHWHRPGLPFRRLEFLASGERARDAICTPYLNVIAERGAEEWVARRLVEAVAEGVFGRCDEVVLPMMAGDGPMPALLAAAFREAGFRAEVVVTSGSPYIPLPATWAAYLGRLSRSHRRQIVRALSAFDRWAGGEVQCERVHDAADLEKGKRILRDLHHARWQGTDRPGVFRSPHFLRFHDELMSWLLGRGALQLLWLSARGVPVAALYNMEGGGKVYSYQMGRRPNLPSAIRPGIVLLAHAIRDAIAVGHQEFDLLNGLAPYKMQLALATRPLVQVRAARWSVVEAVHHLFELGVAGARPVRNAWHRLVTGPRRSGQAPGEGKE